MVSMEMTYKNLINGIKIDAELFERICAGLPAIKKIQTPTGIKEDRAMKPVIAGMPISST